MMTSMSAPGLGLRLALGIAGLLGSAAPAPVLAAQNWGSFYQFPLSAASMPVAVAPAGTSVSVADANSPALWVFSPRTVLDALGTGSIGAYGLPSGAAPGAIATLPKPGSPGTILSIVAEPGIGKVALLDPTAPPPAQIAVTGLSSTSPATFAPDGLGNLMLSIGNGQVARVAPSGGLSYFAAPAGAARLSGLPVPPGAATPPNPLNLALGADGNIWFTETYPLDATGNPIIGAQEYIGNVTPSGVYTQFAVPTQYAGVADFDTDIGTAIAAGPDGNIWFTESAAGKVARVTPAGAITEFALPSSGGGILGIAAGADGNIWVRDFTGKIDRVTPAGVVTSFAVPTPNGGSDVELILGPDGALWFPEDSKIGRVSSTGTITESALPTPIVNGEFAYPEQLRFTPDGMATLILSSSNEMGVFNVPPSSSPLVAAILPSSRSVQVGGTASFYAVMLNAGTAAATGCAPSLVPGIAASFFYQTTDPATNALSGAPNAPVTIAAGGAQTFVIGMAANAAFTTTNTIIGFSCADADAAPVTEGVNTISVSASTTPVPDIVALAATATADGELHIPGSTGTAAFAVATVDAGAGGTITASVDTGSATLPMAASLCQTDPSTAGCLAPLAQTVTTTYAAGGTPTFSIFAVADGSIPFDPGNSRIFVRFSDSSGTVRGSTSVAVATQ